VPATDRRTISPGELEGVAASLLEGGFRLALAAAHEDDGRLRAVYLFTAPRPDRGAQLPVPLGRGHPAGPGPGREAFPHVRRAARRPAVPSLAGQSFRAGRFEREMHDLYGVVPEGHPLPRRLVRHFHWPSGWHPMLAAAGDPPAFGDTDGPYPFRTVEGPGVY